MDEWYLQLTGIERATGAVRTRGSHLLSEFFTPLAYVGPYIVDQHMQLALKGV